MVINKRLKGISMFSSAGIAETYLEDTGIDILLANELIEERANFYSYLYPKTDMIIGDILDYEIFSSYLSKAKTIAPNFLLATPPCQGMSSLGKKDYDQDARNYLIFPVIDVIKQLNLDYILIENVPKFFKLFYPFEGETLGIVEILNRLFSDKYVIDSCVLNAKDYGVPQSRPRAVIKMYKKGTTWPTPQPKKEITLKEAIGHLPSLKSGEQSDIKYHYALNHSQMQVEAMSHTKEGESAMTNEFYYPKKTNGQKVSGFHNTYKRMRWGAPAPARATNNGLISGHNNVHPGRELADGTVSDPRVLSLLELFIVSSLPTNWNIPENYNEYLVRTLIGEAIPPRLLSEIVSTINDRDMIDRSLRQNKWTLMKYVKDFDLIVLYADAVRKGNANVSNDALLEMHERMAAEGIYNPRFGKLSLPTIQFKVCQIVYYMFAYKMKADSRSVNKLVFSPLGNLLLDNMDNPNIVSKTFFCMLYAMPFKHPFNKMRPDFDLYPYRLIFKLLLDDRIDRRLYHDEVFYLVMFTKHIDKEGYEKLIESILELREMPNEAKYEIFTKSENEEDTLANALHEWNFACGTLSGAGILDWDRTNERYGTLVHGRGRAGGQTGRRSYKKDSVQIRPELMNFAEKILNSYAFDEKPSAILSEVLLTSEYVIQLYNFYPPELLQELNISNEIQESIVNILKITEDIKVFSRNSNDGDAYRFEDILCDAFNYFVDVEAEKQALAGTTDVECIYLPENKKFDIEAKSTKNKLMAISAGRLKHHRVKVGSKYTIIITPYFTPAVLDDIKDTETVIVRAASFSNYLYQAVSKHKNDIRYAPIDRIVEDNLGKDITSLINQYVYDHYGVGAS